MWLLSYLYSSSVGDLELTIDSPHGSQGALLVMELMNQLLSFWGEKFSHLTKVPCISVICTESSPCSTTKLNGTNITGIQGYIQSVNYPAEYDCNLSHSWTIVNSGHQTLILDFEELEVNVHKTNIHNYVFIIFHSHKFLLFVFALEVWILRKIYHNMVHMYMAQLVIPLMINVI